MPRLRIADRLEVTDRFLRVRGDLRTYRIHLGSANILMEPDDSYLCVVDARGGTDALYLPFEDDGGRLSLILSKAFLLAADTEITDPAIVRQIRGAASRRPPRTADGPPRRPGRAVASRRISGPGAPTRAATGWARPRRRRTGRRGPGCRR